MELKKWIGSSLLLLLLLTLPNLILAGGTSMPVVPVLRKLLPLIRWLVDAWNLEGPDIYVTSTQYSDGEDKLLDVLQYQSISFARVLFNSPKNLLSMSHFTVVTDSEWRPPPQILHGAWLIPDSGGILPQNLRYDSMVYLYYINNDRTITVLETYVTKKGTKNQQTNEIGVWNCTEHIFKYLGESYIWDRRANLHMQTLTGLYIPGFTPFAYVQEDGTVSGSFIAMARFIAGALNISLILQPQLDSKWGVIGEDGSWNGMIGSLVEKKADWAPLSFGITAERKNAVDFMDVVYKEKVTAVAHDLSKRQAIILTRFFDAFTLQAWCAITVFSLICVTVLKTSFGHQARNNPQSLMESLALVAHLLIFQRDYNVIAKTNSATLAYFMTCLFSFLLFASYSALLTATMIGKDAEINLLTMDDVADSDLSLHIWGDAFTFRKFQVALPNTPWGRAYKNKIKGKEYVFINSYEELYEKLSTNPKSIYIGGDSILAFYPHLHRISTFKDFITTHLSMCLQKNSEYTASFNYQLRKLDQSGIRYKMLQDYGFEMSYIPNKIGFSAEPLGYDNLIFVFFCIGFGVITASIILLLERAIPLVHSLIS